MVNLREAAAGLWRAMRHDPDHPLLHAAYEKVHVEQTSRVELELILGPSRTRYYLARHQGCETVEFITDPDTRTVLAKKYIAVALDARGAAETHMRFAGTVRLVRQLRAARAGEPGSAGPHFRQPGNPRTLLEWFTGSAIEKLLGRPAPDDHLFVNGRLIQPRAYRTLLDSGDGDDLVIELHTRPQRL